MAIQAAPMFAVKDVPATSNWYQRLLACQSDMEQGHPHRREYDRIVDAVGKLLISFHSWSGDDAGTPVDVYLAWLDAAPLGQGVIVSFTLDDLEAAVNRARDLGAEFIGELASYPDRSRAQLLRDPDGYIVNLSSGPPA